MGCDIHSFAEVKRNDKWEEVTDSIFPDYEGKTSEVFNYRDYSLFAFLAGVRNYDCCTPLDEPKGLPYDSEKLKTLVDYGYSTKVELKQDLEENDYHSYSWLTLKELLDFDYNKTFWNRRICKQMSLTCWFGIELAEEGEGKIISYSDNLGESYFEIIDILKTLGEPENVRVVFWFDS